MKKIPSFRFSLLLASSQSVASSVSTGFKHKATKAAAHLLTYAVCLALVIQCLALVQPVSAQAPAVSKVAQTKQKKKTRKNRKKKPSAEDAEAAAALKAQEQAQKEAEALAKKQAAEIAKQEAAEKLAKKKAEEKEKKEAERKEAEDRATSRPSVVMPYGIWANQPTAPSALGNAGALQAPTVKDIPSKEREVTDLGTVNMAALSKSKSSSKTSAEAELAEIDAPQPAPAEGREAIGQGALLKEAKKRKASLDSPIAGVPSPSMVRTFKSDNLSLGSVPPDTMGAVGLNHVVTTTNEKVLIQDRNGVTLSTVSLNAFWAALPNGLANPSTFDPKILYDRFNDRFIMVTQANSFAPTSATLIATSQTGNPLGTWNRYAIDVDATATTSGGNWADYPSIGFNKNWIVISINRFGYGNKGGYQGPSIYVINKTTAYAGTLGVVSTFEDSFSTGCLNLPPASQPQALGCGFTYAPAIEQDNTTNDEYLVEDWDDQFGQLRMSRISGTQVAPILTVGYQFPQSPYGWRGTATINPTGSGGYMPQRQQNAMLVSGTRITSNDARIQNVVLRNGTLWTTHTIELARLQTPAGNGFGSGNPDIRAAVQWWQLDPLVTNTSTGTSPLQRNIIADPRADNCHNGTGGSRAGCTPVGDFYAFPNINVNAANDVLIGYSRVSPGTLAKAAYSFRSGSDPANYMRDSMVSREGMGNYNIGGGTPFTTRWGDYSAVMVDPLNDNDFWTIQEYALDQREIFGPGQFAGLWSTWWTLVTPSTTAPYSVNGGLIISEFRMRGPAGTRDEFVELVNNTNNAITVTTTDGSDGWLLAYSSPSGVVTPLSIIPNGIVIPAHGHYLMTNEVRASGINPYSLSNNPTGNPVRTADGDAMWTPDNADNGGFALFRTSNQNNLIAVAVIDAVGFTSLPAGSIFREGNGLATCSGAPAEQVSFVRKGTAGNPQDTNANENDFLFTSSTGTSSQNCQVPVTAGAPTPLNRDSPPSP
ncbi:MAG TPA: lamin tail domain-containing protein [Pyrinomonadaceae bacterium]|nr:lamin tail domain-containing protein [Pyrinomonadaceae bacterium]